MISVFVCNWNNNEAIRFVGRTHCIVVSACDAAMYASKYICLKQTRGNQQDCTSKKRKTKREIHRPSEHRLGLMGTCCILQANG